MRAGTREELHREGSAPGGILDPLEHLRQGHELLGGRGPEERIDFDAIAAQERALLDKGLGDEVERPGHVAALDAGALEGALEGDEFLHALAGAQGEVVQAAAQLEAFGEGAGEPSGADAEGCGGGRRGGGHLAQPPHDG